MGTACVELAQQSGAACGRSGDQCETCITGEVCVEGKCIVDTGQCSPASCPTGCCEGTVCVQRGDQDWLACRTEAAECETCNTATVCDEGTCTDTFASGDLVGIRINAVEVETTDDGETWDLLGGAPDLFVCVTDGVFEGCTTAGSDTFAVDWGSDGVLTDSAGVEVYFSTDDLIEGNLEYGVFDDDVEGRHLAQSGLLPSTSVFEAEYVIAERAPNLVLLTFSIY